MTRIIACLKHNAIALTALFIALGGTSYAAVAIPRNSVGNRQLRRGAVTASKIRSGAITPSKLSSRSFGGRILDLAEVSPIGRVLMSDPRGAEVTGWTLTSNGGFVSWPHQRTPADCFPVATPSAALSAGPGTGATPPVVGAELAGRGGPTRVQVMTSGEPSVTLMIVCDR